MTYRVSTQFAHERSIEAIAERQTALARAQQELSTGRKLLSPSDDPAAAAQAERARSQLARFDLEKKANEFATNMLGVADGALSSASEVLQYSRESMLRAGNASLSAADRALIAKGLRESREELLNVANRRDGTGTYVFGGQGSTTAPFNSTGTVAFQPLAGEQTVGIDGDFSTSLDGRSTFIDLPSGTASKSVFQTLDDAITLLEDGSAASTTIAAGIRDAVSGIDVALDRVQVKRTEVGEQLRALEGRARLIDSGEIESSGFLSGLVDVDFAKSISDVQSNQTALDAAMRTYAQVSRMSLFDYL